MVEGHLAKIEVPSASFAIAALPFSGTKLKDSLLLSLQTSKMDELVSLTCLSVVGVARGLVVVESFIKALGANHFSNETIK